MATRYAVATGNWSAVGTWDGGASLPGVGDDVYSNNFTVTINQDINVGSLRNTSNASPAITAGGGFEVSTARTITLTGSGIVAGAATCFTYSASSPTSTTINGAIAPSSSGTGVFHAGTGTLNVVGAVTGNSNQGTGIRVNANGAVITVTGNVSGGSLNARGINSENFTSTITVVGNVTGGSGTNAPGIGLGSLSSTVTITGTVLGGSAASTQAGVSSGGGATINITGPVNGGAGGAGVSCTGAVGLTISGALTASSAACAVESTSLSAVNVLSGPLIGNSTTGQSPVLCRIIKLTPTLNDYWTFKNNAGSTTDLVSTDTLASNPSASDVRYGTSYSGGTLTGTMSVPVASQVRIGVAVDNTVGTGYLTPADFWNYLRSNSFTAGSMGEWLKNIATIDAQGHISAAFEQQPS